jgi:hypothetical protein
VIVVAGMLLDEAGQAASAVAIAEQVARRAERVEAVGVLPAGASGDRRLMAIAALGVGHAAVLRSPARELDPGDLELALRYLPDVRAIVLVAPSLDLVRVATEAATWSDAGLVIVSPRGDEDGSAPEQMEGAIVLEPPGSDPDAAFAGLVARLAKALAGGAKPADAWAATVADLGVDPVGASSLSDAAVSGDSSL